MAVQQSMTAQKAVSAADLFPYSGGASAPPAPKGIPQLDAIDGEPVKIQVSQLSPFLVSSGWKSQDAAEVDISMAPLKIPGHDPKTVQPLTWQAALQPLTRQAGNLQQAALQQLMFDNARLGTWPGHPPGAFGWAPSGPAWPNYWPSECQTPQAPPEYWPSFATKPPLCGGSPKSTDAGATSDGESSSPTSGPEDFSLPPPPPPGLPMPSSSCGEIAMDIEQVLTDSLQTTMHEEGAEDHEASPHEFSYSREEMLAVYGATHVDALPSSPPGLASFSDSAMAPPPGLSLPESSSAADLVPSAEVDAGISDMSPTAPSELDQTDCWAAWLADTQSVEEEDQVTAVKMEERVCTTEELSVEEPIVPNVVKMEESVPMTEELSVEEAIVPHMTAECSEECSVEEEAEEAEEEEEEEAVVEEVSQPTTEALTGPESEESLWTVLAYEDRFATEQEEGTAAPTKLVESTSRKGAKQRQQRAKAKAVVSAPLPESKAIVAETLPKASVVEAKSAPKADAAISVRSNVRVEPKKHRTKAQVVRAAKGPQDDFFDFEKPSRGFSPARFVWWHLLLALCLFSGVMFALDTRMGESHVDKAAKPRSRHSWGAAKPSDQRRKDIAYFAKKMDVEFSRGRAVASELNAQVKDLRSTMKAVRQAEKLAARNRKKARKVQRQQERQWQMQQASW